MSQLEILFYAFPKSLNCILVNFHCKGVRYIQTLAGFFIR